VANAAYPSTFPFENESYKPDFAGMPTGPPSKTYDDNDPGGYARDGYAMIDLDDDCEWPWQLGCYWGWDHIFWKQWEVEVYGLPAATWNCSVAGHTYAPSDFPGTLGTYTVDCGSDGCCEGWIGQLKFGTDQLEKQDGMAALYAGGGCSMVPEAVYCGVGDVQVDLCMEYYTSKDTRSVMKPCPDTAIYYWLTDCKVFKAAGMFEDSEVVNQEPASYLASLSSEQTLYVKALINLHEHMCLPVSYYGGAEEDPDSSAAIPSLLMVLSVFVLYM